MTAIAVRDSVVLRGYVTRPEDIPRIMDIAKEFYPNVINQMEVGGDQEVELKVKVIEIDRTKLKELGFNFLGTTNFAFLGSLPGGLAPLATLTTPLGSIPAAAIPLEFENLFRNRCKRSNHKGAQNCDFIVSTGL